MTIWMPRKKPLYAPMLGTFGGGSANGFRGGGGSNELYSFSAFGTMTIVGDEGPNAMSYSTMRSRLDVSQGTLTSSPIWNNTQYLGIYSAYSGTAIRWVVPETRTYRFVVIGAAGGSKTGPNVKHGGRGRRITIDIPLYESDHIFMRVGHIPVYNGVNGNGGLGGGGGSYVVRYYAAGGSTTPLVVAGGGAGASHNQPGRDANWDNNTGNGNGDTGPGTNGNAATGSTSAWCGGGGGGYNSGAAPTWQYIYNTFYHYTGGQGFLSGSTAGTGQSGYGGYHSQGFGGYGGGGGASDGAGGGGGYSGGAGGTDNNATDLAGGGGSWYNASWPGISFVSQGTPSTPAKQQRGSISIT